MKVILANGSPHKNGCKYTAIFLSFFHIFANAVFVSGTGERWNCNASCGFGCTCDNGRCFVYVSSEWYSNLRSEVDVPTCNNINPRVAFYSAINGNGTNSTTFTRECVGPYYSCVCKRDGNIDGYCRWDTSIGPVDDGDWRTDECFTSHTIKCSAYFEFLGTGDVPLSPCFNPYPISAPVCKGGVGLWGIADSSGWLSFPGIETNPMNGNPAPYGDYYFSICHGESDGHCSTAFRPDGTECDASNNFPGDVAGYTCLLGLDPDYSSSSGSGGEPSSSGNSSSSSDTDGSSSSIEEPSSSSSGEPSSSGNSSSSSGTDGSSSSIEEPSSSSSGSANSSSSFSGDYCEDFPDSILCERTSNTSDNESSSSLPIPYSSSTAISSSSEAYSSGSLSGSGENNGCLDVASKPLLQKPVNYDDWVYIGKETYGSRVVRQNSLKPSTKLFDVLGRVYGKIVGHIKQYLSKPVIDRRKYDVALEFEVWARIIKDGDGNDIHAFIKEDKAHGLRRDSSFYYNGYWEVFEFDDVANETKFKASSGIRSLRKYDDREHLKEYYRIDEKGDTLESQRYEWKNGRLIRMTANGVVRNYIYGKTLQDTVRVEPTDDGFNYHRGYNGTVGKIPGEGTPEYEIFARSPYGHVHFVEMEEDEQYNIYFAAKKSVQLNILAKAANYGCVEKEDNFPEARCVKFSKDDALASITRENVSWILSHGYPCGKESPVYGRSDFKLSLSQICKCNESGKYQPYFTGGITDPWIEVYLNSWVYESSREDWRERCWRDEDLKQTYKHEMKHISNARFMSAALNSYVLRFEVDTKKECEKNITWERKVLEEKWEEWYGKEQYHRNPSSPKYTGLRNPGVCR